MAIQPPKTVKISNFGHKFAPQGSLVCTTFIRNSQILYASLLIWLPSGDKQPNYKHFPAVGAFSLKFSIAPSGQTTYQIKKVRGAKTVRTSSITVPSTVVIVGRAPAVDEKVCCFLSVCLSVCLSRFGITKFVLTETA